MLVKGDFQLRFLETCITAVAYLSAMATKCLRPKLHALAVQ